MKQKVWGLSLGLMLCTGALYADEGTTSQRQEPDGRAKLASIEAVQQTDAEAAPRKRRFTIGGYGEAVYSYNFYSDNYLRYDSPQNYKDDTHGRFDLPHVVIMLGYDFGKGWTMGTEIEFNMAARRVPSRLRNTKAASTKAKWSVAVKWPSSSFGFRSPSVPSSTSSWATW